MFFLSFELSDGQTREEKGTVTKVGENEILTVIGSYSYKGSDGKTYVVDYSADPNGFKAKVTSTKSIIP